MPEKKFDLGEYVEVKDRIAKFYELYGNGRLVTETVTLTKEPDGKPRVMVRALAYRNPDDLHPAVGTSWMELPGTTPYTKGSEVENAETSAWGRAIAALGILTDKSIASAQEVANKKTDDVPGAPVAPPPPAVETETSRGHIVREGVIAKGTGRNSDLEWRQTPDAYHIGFLLEVGDGKARPQVAVAGPLAVALFAATSLGGAGLLGVRIKVEGEAFEVTQPGRRAFYRIKAERLTTADWIIPPLEPTQIPREPTDAEQDELDQIAANL